MENYYNIVVVLRKRLFRMSTNGKRKSKAISCETGNKIVRKSMAKAASHKKALKAMTNWTNEKRNSIDWKIRKYKNKSFTFESM